ncbi:hypothetical protein Mapa_011590 [Marchantia paleacea]|nr:hypothetical protein Mapa_011590 [Marchantia paleacea]
MVGVATGNRFLATAPMDLDLLCKGQQTAFDVSVSHLATLKGSTVESSLIKAVLLMQDFFLLRFKHGKLPSSSIPQKSCGIESASRMNGVDSEHWEAEAYTVYINLLLELMIKEGVSSLVHVQAVRTLMEFVRVETPGSFSHALYGKLMKVLVTANHSIFNIVAVLESDYFQYADVRYFTASEVRRLADERASMKLDNETTPSGLQMFVRNLYEILSHLPTTLKGDSGSEGSETVTQGKIWCNALTTKSNLSSEAESDAVEIWKDVSIQKEAFMKSWKSCLKLSQPLSIQKKNYGDMLSRVLSITSRSCAIAAPDSFLTSLADEVDERLMQLAACKDSTTDDLFPVKGLKCGRSIEAADWMVSAARGKEEDDDDDDDDDDEDEDEDEDDDDDAKDAGGEDDDVEGEEGEEEGEDEEEDDDGEADDNGEDDDGEEEDGEDDDGDEDAEGEEEEEDDEDGDHDEDDDDEDAEGESEEDVEPPKKKRK